MNKRDFILFNRYVISGIILFSILVTSATYSYLAYRYENTVAIKGNVISINATLDVELVSGNNGKLVPLKDGALNNAINGVGSPNGACIDANGNLSCQVYKIKFTNHGSRLQDIRGSIKLYSVGSNSKYTNLKWRELASPTAVKDGSLINGMKKTNLVQGLTVESGQELVYYIGVYIQEIDADQTNTDKGKFEGTVTFETSKTGDISDIITSESKSDTGINFSRISSDTNGKGVYLLSGTETEPNPIYYYRGDVNNNLIFADMCFKIVRTTETGGVKLIYNGLPDDNDECNATGASTAIGNKAFNSSYNSPAYVGYMYGTVYNYSTSNALNETYLYGSDVTYSNGQYTLTGTPQTGYSEGINNYHYTCGSTSDTCTSIKYIYYVNGSTGYYITLSGGKKVETALSEMFDYNTHPSTIKGNEDTTGTIDNWYYTNIEQAGYADYVEDTVWCNDRSIYQKGGWDPNGGSTSSYLYFGAYGRNVSNKTPSLTCERPIDRFTVSDENGNGALDYPVGLLTTDEIVLAGAVYGTSNSTYYLYSGDWYWAGSPYRFSNYHSRGFVVDSSGNLDNGYVVNAIGVRPSVSLKPGTDIVGGSGAKNDPYIILTN